MSLRNDLDAFLSQAKTYGCETKKLSSGHYEIRYNGRRVGMCPSTPSDYRSIRNSRCQLRAELNKIREPWGDLGNYNCSRGADGRTLYTLRCESCGATDEIRSTNNLVRHHTEIIVGFKQKGWRTPKRGDYKNTRCPKCVESRAEKQSPAVTAPHPAPLRISTPAPALGMEIPVLEIAKGRVLNPKMRMRIIQVIAKYYGEGVGYASDWSDGRIAKALAIPAEWVTYYREAIYGQEPEGLRDRIMAQEMLALKTEVDKLTSQVVKIAAQIEARVSKVMELARKEGDACPDALSVIRGSPPEINNQPCKQRP